MIKEEILDRCLIVSFSQGERTEQLNDLCFKKLGFKNRLTLSGEGGFDDKFLEFAKIATESNYEFFIRNDADRLVFNGILDLLKLMIDDPTISWSTGVFYDYLMDKKRGGTPSIHRIDNLDFLVKNSKYMKNVQKPESNFARAIKDKFNLKDVNILTNLHDYEQYPSKVCNTLINRYYRNDWGRLYNIRKLRSNKIYGDAVCHAEEYIKVSPPKKSMDYVDFSHLDEGMAAIEDNDLELKYNHYKDLYESLNKK